MAEIEIIADGHSESRSDGNNNNIRALNTESSSMPIQTVHNTDQESQEETPLQVLAHDYSRRFYKVPISQRSDNSSAFDPLFFSFGPYHADSARLRNGEHIKRMVAADLIVPNGGLEQLVNKIREDESQLRDIYIQMREVQHAGLAELLAMDSVFLVNNALRISPGFIQKEVYTDALLLENQVPIFVLEYALESLAPGRTQPLAAVLKYYHRIGASLSPFAMATFDGSGSFPIDHQEEALSLLGSVYDYLIAAAGNANPISSNDVDDAAEPLLPSEASLTASCLAKCGMRFKPCNSGFRGIEWRAESWELCLPRIKVNHSTLHFLYNLLAYETIAKGASSQPVTSYIVFMSCLLNADEDVQVLVNAGVVTNGLGSHENLASSWKKLCTNVMPGWSHTAADRVTMTRVAMFTRRRWHGWKVAFQKLWRFLVSLNTGRLCRLAFRLGFVFFDILFVYHQKF